MALNYIGPLKSLLERGDFPSESSMFRLHYQFTTALLLGSSIFLTANEFFGETINCMTDLPNHVINTYCWIKSTFTMDDYQYREVGRLVAQPGVGPPEGGYSDEELEEMWTFHNYYQWVVFFLCGQAALFYLPKVIWNGVEGGLMKSIASGLNKTLYKEDEVDGRKQIVIEYIITHIRMHNSYVYKYWFCELFCFVNIILQMFFVDKFLGNQFLTYGTDVVKYSNMDQTERVDPMIFVFPRMTKCLFHKFGPSGNIVRHDAFCLLPLNILNEKIFILQWFWFIILASLFGILIIYRLALLLLPGLRPRVMHQHNRAVPIEALQAFTSKTSIGDWWILYVLSKNIDPLIYRDIMSRLAKEIETSASNNPYGSSAPNLYASSSV
uniref:Innexin n=1 Tax=Hirondellea gigas TaxID=1518452 RepID=A0A2P2HW92_9CRUS